MEKVLATPGSLLATHLYSLPNPCSTWKPEGFFSIPIKASSFALREEDPDTIQFFPYPPLTLPHLPSLGVSYPQGRTSPYTWNTIPTLRRLTNSKLFFRLRYPLGNAFLDPLRPAMGSKGVVLVILHQGCLTACLFSFFLPFSSPQGCAVAAASSGPGPGLVLGPLFFCLDGRLPQSLHLFQQQVSN